MIANGERLILETPRRAYETASPSRILPAPPRTQRHPYPTLQPPGKNIGIHPTATLTAALRALPRWRQQLDVVLRQEHLAGGSFVDYAGATIPSRSARRAGAQPGSS